MFLKHFNLNFVFLSIANQREGSLEPKASGESKITLERDDSPEFLPTSAKVQKLTKEKTELAEEVAAKRGVDQELQSTHLETTSNAVKPASERLKSIREKEQKIEELLMQLESNIKRGKKTNGMIS